MEVLEERIKEFLTIKHGSGDGDGYGFGFGSGNGSVSGDGDGFGSGNGYSDGSGDGDGFGSGNGYGNDSGNGSGSGDGFGSGNGYSDGSGNGDGYGFGNGFVNGSGDGLKSINNKKIYRIDNIDTIIDSIHNNIARGFIVNRDLTLEKCYVAKGQNKFAHGETIKKAVQALREKIYEDLDTDEAIEEFRKNFNNTDKYKASEFYTWHHILTGSCEMGRKSFARNNDIDIDIDEFTVQEFIRLTENDDGGEIIRKLKEFYK